MRVLVVDDGWLRGALPGVRILARHGVEVGVGSPSPGDPAAASRAARWHHVVPPVGAGVGPFLAALQRAIDQGGYDVVLPAGDGELLAVSAARDDLGASVPYPAHDRVVGLLDKDAMSALAEDAGVRVPGRYPVTAIGSLDPPYVVKARTRFDPSSPLPPGRADSRVFSDAGAATRYADDLVAAGVEPFLQEHVEGELVGLSTVVGRDGRLLGVVQHRGRGRTWPAGAGMRVRSVTEPVDERLRVDATRLLAAAGWWGIADVDAIDGPDGPRIIDVNVRLFGTLPLADAAGVPLPVLWLEAARDTVPAGTLEGRPGVRYQWLEGDLKRARVERRGGLVRDVVETLRWGLGARHHTASWRDPGPAWALARRLARAARSR